MLALNNIINQCNPEKLGRAANAILWLASLITTIAIFVPFSPKMPAAGLDQSWVFGMNQAVAQGLSFGKEIIFSYGPYSSIHTKTYHPSTDFMMVSGSLYLALAYWAYLFLLMGNVQWLTIISLNAVLAGVVNTGGDFYISLYSRDALLFSLPLLAGVVIFKIQTAPDGGWLKNKTAPFLIALLISPLGFLPLVKCSIMILCSAVALLCSALFFANGHKLLATLCLLSPMASMLFFWVASGQSAADLPGYFVNTTPIVSGFSEAMALDGNIYEVVLYLLASAFLLLAISLQTQATGAAKIFLSLIYFFCLFLSFKAGFVRHDDHALISGISILIAALLLPFIINAKIVVPASVFALIAWFYIDSYHINTSTVGITENIRSTYAPMWRGIKNRVIDKNWPRLEFDAAINTIKEKTIFPVLPGTTDIYSYNQAYLIASENTWSPRPIFQSYSAYTPELAGINRKHLLSHQAPDNIIFRVERIDGRIPSIADGASWPILMLNYRPTQLEGNFLFLQKKGAIGEIGDPLEPISEKHTFGETVNLPESGQPLFVRIGIKPTLLGRIASMLFKPSQLQITLALRNGLKKQFRIIADMAKSGLVLSPLIENTTEFGMLYGKEGLLDGKLVKSMSIAPRDGKTLLWHNEYSVSFSQISYPFKDG
ncbi:MAG: hypothetical protein CTY16_15310 [Methylobacter sp.]|nr:MAG: hypothetical protein CTY16_15310 [Methylobacter sp.]